jgi:hypothetical protein
MTPSQPIRATRMGFVVACLATLVLTLAACGATPPTGPAAATVPLAVRTSPPPAAAPSPAPAVDAPSVAPQSPASAPAGQAQTIHVLEYPADWAEVKVGSLSGCKDTTCLGDYLVGRSSMADAATKTTVGTLVTECFVVDAGSGRYHCPATTIALTGRGQIVFTEDVLLGPHICPTCSFTPEAGGYAVDFPVIGGSGEFLGATGVVTSPAGSTWKYGDFVITLTK